MPSLHLPWASSDNTSSDTQIVPRARAAVAELEAKTASLPPHVLVLTAFCVGSCTTLGSVYVYRRFFRRIPNSEWVTPDMLAKKRWINGYVTSVGDADNFRVYHTPGFGWRWPLKFRFVPSGGRDLKDQTIHIRLAGVDAPEAAHFGRPAQEFSEESLEWLKKKLEGRNVHCQLLRRDQYGRIVAFVHMEPRLLPRFMLGKPVSLEMLRAGWVETYEQTGAEYGPWGKDEFLRLQREAQAARRGIWRYGTDGESPAEYKRRYATGEGDKGSEATPNNSPNRRKVKDSSENANWMRRFLRWVRQ